MVRPGRNAAPTPSFATSECSAVGGSTRLNLDPRGQEAASRLLYLLWLSSRQMKVPLLCFRSVRQVWWEDICPQVCVCPWGTTLCCHSSCDPLLEPPNRTNFHHNQTVLLPQFQLDLYPLCCELLESHEAPGTRISPSASVAVLLHTGEKSSLFFWKDITFSQSSEDILW